MRRVTDSRKTNMLVGAVGVLALQVLLVGGVLSMDSVDPILLNPDKELSNDGVSMVMLCGEASEATPEGRGSKVLEEMPLTETWARGRGGGRYGAIATSGTHHNILYNPHAIEECWIGCDHDYLERRLR
jgi:hypothetical protein